MALFVDLDDEDVEPPQGLQSGKLIWDAKSGTGHGRAAPMPHQTGPEEAREPATREDPNRNSVTAALGCYPIIMAVATAIDLNTLDNLSRTCRQVHNGLLQYRKTLLAATLRCSNDHLPVDADEALRYRARATNWYFVEDVGRTSYNGKTGQCARDMVSECRRCGTVVCRNCTIKPPAPIVLRDRHRRLCRGCTQAPMGELVKPALPPSIGVDSDLMQHAKCTCENESVWLCQPCGRSIRGADYDYQAIWKWRNQYGEVLGGLGTGIGEGDRGVVCGRAHECSSSKEKEQETDCDADDAREASEVLPTPPGSSSSASASTATSTTTLQPPWGSLGMLGNLQPERRTPSPALGPGYARHEMVGLGGVVKLKRVRMVRVGACVPEWEDEKAKGEILGREVSGRVRSWCGWCCRVIPGKKEL